MTGTIEFSEGDTLTHSKYGDVTIRGVVEELDSFVVTDTGSKTVFEGGNVDTTTVKLETDGGMVVHESMDDFMDEFV